MWAVEHSMHEEQVHRISAALRESASAIQGINLKFDTVDEHWEKMWAFNEQIAKKIDETLASFSMLDSTMNSRVALILDSVAIAADELEGALEGTLLALSRFDLRRETTQLPKIIIPLALPLIVLLIELAVSNAYLGILLASLPEVRSKTYFSRFLLVNASAVLFGLMLSVLSLLMYRFWLSRRTRKFESAANRNHLNQQDKLKRFRDGVWPEAGVGVDPDAAQRQRDAEERVRQLEAQFRGIDTFELEAELGRRSSEGGPGGGRTLRVSRISEEDLRAADSGGTESVTSLRAGIRYSNGSDQDVRVLETGTESIASIRAMGGVMGTGGMGRISSLDAMSTASTDPLNLGARRLRRRHSAQRAERISSHGQYVHDPAQATASHQLGIGSESLDRSINLRSEIARRREAAGPRLSGGLGFNQVGRVRSGLERPHVVAGVDGEGVLTPHSHRSSLGNALARTTSNPSSAVPREASDRTADSSPAGGGTGTSAGADASEGRMRPQMRLRGLFSAQAHWAPQPQQRVE